MNSWKNKAKQPFTAVDITGVLLFVSGHPVEGNNLLILYCSKSHRAYFISLFFFQIGSLLHHWI